VRTVRLFTTVAALAMATAPLVEAVGFKTVVGTPGNDTLYGTPESDRIYGYAGQDFLYGGKGNDRLDGGSGQDHLKGGPGNDVIIGGRPRAPVDESTPHGPHEYIRGGTGNDVITIRGAGVVIWDGPGDDRIDLRDPLDDCKFRHGALAAADAPARALDPLHCVDLVNTGPGDNFVRADDGNYDGIDCFGRRDRVVVDQYDYVNENCDVVRRVKR
jgi:Ca2+-binding RTX toxin-like protein